VTDDVGRLWELVTRDPGSLEFLELGERLRRRGDLESAARVALQGLQRHPELPDAHDVYARILVDMGDEEAAEDEWRLALEREPRHLGALKGLGFLRYRAGDYDAALDHLEAALAVAPRDAGIVRALETVRAAAGAAEAPAGDRVFSALGGDDEGMLLADLRGRVLGGRVVVRGRGDASERVAGYLAGAVQEAERTARMLGMGSWQWIVTEAAGGNLYATPISADTVLCIVRDRSIPAGRLAMLAERAAAVARRWLEQQRL
jgi:tetratricopeptide (TPR) repeat protein